MISLTFLILIVYIIMNNKAELKKATLSWRGITPGQTTEEQVLALLGEPNSIRESQGETVYQYTQPGTSYVLHYIYLKNHLLKGKIVSWLNVARGVDKENPYLIVQAIGKYGVVDTAINRFYYDHLSRGVLYIWANQGIALYGVPAGWLGIELPRDVKAQWELENRGQVGQKYLIYDPGGYFNFTSKCDVVISAVIFPPMDVKECWSKYGMRVSEPANHGEDFFSQSHNALAPCGTSSPPRCDRRFPTIDFT